MRRADPVCLAGAVQLSNRQLNEQDREMYQTNRRTFMLLGLGSLSAASTGFSSAFAHSDYPQRPIRLIIPRSAGGVLDIIGRHVANWDAWILAAVGVQKFGGGGGMTGTAMVAH